MPGRAALLSNTYPLFVTLFGAVFFGVRLRPRILACIAICTGGAVLVMRDGSGASLLGEVIALGSALFAGVAINFVRRAAQHDNPFMLYFSPCLFGLPLFVFVPRDAGRIGGIVGLVLNHARFPRHRAPSKC